MIITKQSHLTLVIPVQPTARELFAAQELQKYLKTIFNGISVTIATDQTCTSGDVILIGGPQRNIKTADSISAETFNALVPGPEGIYIQAFSDHTLICAGSHNPNDSERGTLYAVYELLERFLGCSLAAYVNPDIAGGEYLPDLLEADLTDIHYIKAAADNPYRTAIAEYHGRKVDCKKQADFVPDHWYAFEQK